MITTVDYKRVLVTRKPVTWCFWRTEMIIHKNVRVIWLRWLISIPKVGPLTRCCGIIKNLQCSKKVNWQMCIDFQNYFTRWFVIKFSMYTSQWYPPHLQYVATLPRENRKSKNVTDFDSTSTDCWHVPGDTLRTWFNIQQ